MARNWYLYAPSHHRSSASFCTYIGSPISRSISSWCRGINLCRPRCVASSSSSWVNGTPPLPSKWKNKLVLIAILVILIRSKTIYNTNNINIPSRLSKLYWRQQNLQTCTVPRRKSNNKIIGKTHTHTHIHIVKILYVSCVFYKIFKNNSTFLSKIQLRFNCKLF